MTWSEAFTTVGIAMAVALAGLSASVEDKSPVA